MPAQQVYLDYNATTPTDPQVVEAMLPFLGGDTAFGNPGRAHWAGAPAKAAIATILPEIISKEPLGPVVLHGDQQWGDIVRWTLNALLTAEELGVTQGNVAEMAASSDNPEVKRMLGAEGDLGGMLDLAPDWVVHAISAGGNYGELFSNTIGDNSPIGIERGINALWTNGGLQYTPFATVSEADAQNSISCLSPAKSFNIAACCSAFTLVPDEDRRKSFQAENSRLTVNKNNAFASVAMQAAYADGGPWLDAAMRYIEGNLELVRNRVSGISTVRVIEPEGTFLLWLDFRELGLQSDDLTEFLRQEAGWAITRGIAFGPEGAGFGRLNIACPRGRLENALDRLDAATRKHR